MLTALPKNPLVPFEVYDRQNVRDYLGALEEFAPGWNLSADVAVVLGVGLARAVREGYWDRARARGIRDGFVDTELDTMATAALTWLLPPDPASNPVQS